MAKKSTRKPLEYTYEKLSRILREATAKVDSGKADQSTILLGGAAAHALDLIDVSRAAGSPLDLTVRTEDNILPALMRIGYQRLQEGMPEEEIRASLTKKYGSYELFSITNTINDGGKRVEIVLRPGIFAEPKLIIRTRPDAKGAVHSFDVFAAAKAATDEFIFPDPEDSDTAMMFGLVRFYERFRTELLQYYEDGSSSEETESRDD